MLDQMVNAEDVQSSAALQAQAAREGSQYVLRVDGFSRRKDNPLRVPDYLFFAEEHDEEFNGIGGASERLADLADGRALWRVGQAAGGAPRTTSR